MKKKGFTLVELLAVIVILAIILMIVVPQIISVINESRKGALASSAKIIASSAETLYLTNETLGVNDTITCDNTAELTSEDYETCTIKFVGKEAQVTIVGKGKFKGMYVCGGTKSNAVATEEECAITSTVVEKIEELAVEGNSEGLETTTDGNIRYTGSNPNNYVTFNNETWRIIGIFEVETNSGTKERLVKIVRNDSLGSMSWDSSTSTVNGGYGINEWSQADLQSMLNGYYIGNSTTCRYCNGYNQASCSNDCSSTVKQINSTYKNMIQKVRWNTGAIRWASTITADSAYSQERSTTTGKICTSGNGCNDTVTRETSWTGLVGLIYPSDYGYASTDTSCRANIYDTSNVPCKNNNWLHNSSYYWTLSPTANSSLAGRVWGVISGGFVLYDGAYFAGGVRPAIYLKSNVLISSGEGTSSSPYTLSMS